MDTKYKVINDSGTDFGSFSKLEDAKEHAQETADYLQIDVFIEKVTTEYIQCFFPEQED